jgi:hypothetical protein
MAYLFYFALLAVWPLLLWPALRLKGWSRAWLLIAAVAGALATAHEIRMFIEPAAIRLDIPLIAIALGVLYASAVAVLFLARWRKSAAVMGVVLVAASGGLSYTWIESGREAQRLTEVFHTRNVLLFEAKFSSIDAYASYFRMFDARPTPYPVGHWEAQGEGYFTRLIVNPEGRAWAFYPCGEIGRETECTYHSSDPGVRAAGDPAERRWEVTLAPPAGAPVTLHIAQPDSGHLTLEGRGQPTTLAKTPPPIDPAPARESLIFLGSFAGLECRGQYADVRQLWLWREGVRLYAVGIFSTLVAGAHAGYISPILLGEGVRQGESWSFEWRGNGRAWSASVALEGPDASLRLERDGAPAESIALEREAVFRDETIELAPLTGKADWDHWFDIVLVGHFSSGDIPAC